MKTALTLIFGLIFVGCAALGVRRRVRLARHGLRTTGQVVTVEESVSTSRSGDYTSHIRVYTPVVVFRTAEGRQVRFEGPGSSGSPMARPGDVVPVVYDPAHPSTADIDTAEGRSTALIAIIAVVGLGVFAFGVHLLL